MKNDKIFKILCERDCIRRIRHTASRIMLRSLNTSSLVKLYITVILLLYSKSVRIVLYYYITYTNKHVYIEYVQYVLKYM